MWRYSPTIQIWLNHQQQQHPCSQQDRRGINFASHTLSVLSGAQRHLPHMNEMAPQKHPCVRTVVRWLRLWVLRHRGEQVPRYRGSILSIATTCILRATTNYSVNWHNDSSTRKTESSPICDAQCKRVVWHLIYTTIHRMVISNTVAIVTVNWTRRINKALRIRVPIKRNAIFGVYNTYTHSVITIFDRNRDTLHLLPPPPLMYHNKGPMNQHLVFCVCMCYFYITAFRFPVTTLLWVMCGFCVYFVRSERVRETTRDGNNGGRGRGREGPYASSCNLCGWSLHGAGEWRYAI